MNWDCRSVSSAFLPDNLIALVSEWSTCSYSKLKHNHRLHRCLVVNRNHTHLQSCHRYYYSGYWLDAHQHVHKETFSLLINIFRIACTYVQASALVHLTFPLCIKHLYTLNHFDPYFAKLLWQLFHFRNPNPSKRNTILKLKI